MLQPFRVANIAVLSLALSQAVGSLAVTPGDSFSSSSLSSKGIVDLGYASYLGNFTPPLSLAFLGLPYAEPPVGDLRFRATVPLDETKLSKEKKGVQNAQSYPNFCIQGTTGQGDAGGAGTEDCLKVNVYTPANATAESKLPVLVYIHGGGYIYGNPRNWPFEHWINFSPHVVVVSVYYRLSSLGFLAHPSFSDGSEGDMNAGFIDQTEALRWIQRHISAFGGDPEKVTINGQSAGGGSVELHMASSGNTGEKLFSGGIGQSIYRSRMPTAQEMLPLFNFYAEKIGCDTSATTSKIFQCLREAPISRIAPAQDASSSFNGSLYNAWLSAIDGKNFKTFPTNTFLDGTFTRVPMMIGATSNETQGGSDFDTALKNMFPALTSQDLANFQNVYDPSDFPSEMYRVDTMTGETQLRCGREILGNAGVKFTDAFTYRYNQPDPIFGTPGFVAHAAENSMMFLGSETGFNGTTTFHQLSPIATAFSQELIAYWLSFVRSGNPNTFKLERSPEWPSFATGQRIVLQEDPNNSTTHSGNAIEEEPSLEAERCAFIASMTAHMQD